MEHRASTSSRGVRKLLAMALVVAVVCVILWSWLFRSIADERAAICAELKVNTCDDIDIDTLRKAYAIRVGQEAHIK